MFFQNSLGIDIQETSVSVTWLKGSFKGVVVADFQTCEHDPSQKESFTSFLENVISDFINRNNIDSCDVYVGIPEESALVKKMVLPYSVRDDLDSVLKYEVEKFIPIPLKDISYDYEIAKQDKAIGTIDVLLAIVKKDLLTPLIDLKNYIPGGLTGIVLKSSAVEKFNLHLTSRKRPLFIDTDPGVGNSGDLLKLRSCAIAFQAFNRSGKGINFLPETFRKKAGRGSFYLFICMTVICIVVFTIMCASYSLHNRIENQRFDSKLTELTKQVLKVEKAQSRINVLEKRINQIHSIVDNTPSCVEILREISEIVPTSAWIDQFIFKDGNIKIKGTASNASDLIKPIEESAFFFDVRFESKISITENKRESFTIGMKLENGNEK